MKLHAEEKNIPGWEVVCPVCGKRLVGFTEKQAMNNARIHFISTHDQGVEE